MKHYCHSETPIGQLLLIGKNGLLEKIYFPKAADRTVIEDEWELNEEPFADVLNQLKEYFAGRLQEFNVKMHLQGTDFQIRVWEELQQIPYGRTASYGEIAKRIGNPKACRAVGGANRKNPIPIIIPCHRIIGSDGSLTGFGGGLDLKKNLLQREKLL
ncbi:MAG: methylated-DNA--[protein]-cysteine S-methyltransferase [Deltaproteobacteria bacterium]|nr:methylated-DNA--[protein]-cysteine S-methyltransferase [Deltaproteobacteria bacterium]